MGNLGFGVSVFALTVISLFTTYLYRLNRRLALTENELRVSNAALSKEVIERKQIEKALEQQAYYDGLTTLPNRTLFDDRLHQALALAKREAGRLALLFVDLDMFKAINDNHGHHVGDLLLKEVAKRLRDSIRETDTV